MKPSRSWPGVKSATASPFASPREQEHVGPRPAFEVVCAAAAVQVVVAAAAEQEVSEAAARKRVVALVAEAPHARAAEEHRLDIARQGVGRRLRDDEIGALAGVLDRLVAGTVQ